MDRDPQEPAKTKVKGAPAKGRRPGRAWRKGDSPNPGGRPKPGTPAGRSAALDSLDRVLSNRRNRAALERALAAAIHKDGYAFFRNIVLPLLPKPRANTLPKPTPKSWQPLDTDPMPPSDASTEPDASGSEPSAPDDDSERPGA